MYRVRQNKTPQHENRNFSEMREYFCIKFCSFVQHITAHESVVSCRIYSTYAEMTET